MDENSLDRNADALLGNLLRVQAQDEHRSDLAVTLPGRPISGAGPEWEEPRPTAIIGPPVAAQGEWIGRYRLLQELGEGGFGVVWEAEQREPVRRRVALKIIKLGMDTREVIARFEAERQALALMDHPNIARVLDAGATEIGRPYFVMELVPGVPLTSYCDRQKLGVRERLELFIMICQAVQHAHQKGVIHRDIKPSNVLVAMMDGKPVPKIIDFGIARATNQQLTEKTLFTQLGQLIGTPEYMSPEQAGLSGLDVDTRTDVYSLGVVLYELLTGETPLDRRKLRRLAFAEIQRAVCDEEPQRPSTRISTLGASSSEIAARRHMDPTKLGRTLRGDLDWIVMRALEKDRMRRYETAHGLALDIQRYLNMEPVEAGPPSVSYRLERFVARNRSAVITGAAVAAMLVAATVISVWQAMRATSASHLANTRLEEIKRQEQMAVHARQRAETARQDAEDLIGFLLSDLKDGLAPIGRVDLMRGIAEKVQDYYAREDRSEGNASSLLRGAQAQGVLAEVAEITGRAEEADKLNGRCIEALEQWTRTHGRTSEALRSLAEAHERQAQFNSSPRWGRQTDGASAQASLGMVVQFLKELYASHQATMDDKWRLVQSMVLRAQQLRFLGRREESESLLLEAARVTLVEERRAGLSTAGLLAKGFLACEASWEQLPAESFHRSWSELLENPALASLQPVRELLKGHPDDQRIKEQTWRLVSWPAASDSHAGCNEMIRFSMELGTN